ncbi:divisome protein SepX/GlpR [Streptacidiphilus rugosus]|uniref:divisome protein SepX/GlpR n=1 Tax=Streptacidiphilus rugosus TaxID=405783 RepID=UPI00055AD716|nr:hypothetical protein [Streptacidiphilus rugosus]
MSSSGLIYAVIVGAWAAYLVPMWLRRQDELNEARPTEKFSTAIRLLSGRAAMERKISRQLEETQALAPPTPVPAAPAHQPAQAGAVSREPSPSAAESRRRAALLARRRRMVVVLFAAFTLGMIAAAVGGVALLWIPAVPAVLFSLYIAQMRRQEHRRYEVKLDRRRAAEAAQRVRQQAAARRAPEAAPAAVPEPVEGPAERTTAGTGSLAPAHAAEAAVQPWTDDDRPDHASAAPQAGQADDVWNPVPVPLPTYVTAPVAPRATLGLDLSAPNTYSSGRGPASKPATPRRPAPKPATPLFDQFADDAPRAANE